MIRRPGSLAEVAAWSTEPRAFWYHVMDFADELRRVRDPAMLAEDPARLEPHLTGGDVMDAYLAAVAVSLARELGVVPPPWARDASRALRRPWFAHPGAALRATLLAESPAPFRERNLFVSANALSRA
jgi:hypothetical protein